MKPRIQIANLSSRDTLGEFDPQSKQITISSKLSKKQFPRVLMHELVHYFLDKKFKNRKGPRREEEICEALEPIGDYLNVKKLLK